MFSVFAWHVNLLFHFESRNKTVASSRRTDRHTHTRERWEDACMHSLTELPSTFSLPTRNTHDIHGTHALYSSSIEVPRKREERELDLSLFRLLFSADEREIRQETRFSLSIPRSCLPLFCLRGPPGSPSPLDSRAADMLSRTKKERESHQKVLEARED